MWLKKVFGEQSGKIVKKKGGIYVPWCPDCRSEYRESFTTCADCGVPLVEELALEGKDNKPISYSNWALLLQNYDEREAEMLQALLQSAGIPVIRKDRGAGGYLKIHMGMNKLGVDIYVPEEYYEEALSVIPPVEGQFLDRKDEELVLQSNQRNPRIEKKHKASSWIYFLAFAIPMIIYLLSSF